MWVSLKSWIMLESVVGKKREEFVPSSICTWYQVYKFVLQLKSLEKRLKVTEERLHQERADRANNLSNIEDKLLTENAKLQVTNYSIKNPFTINLTTSSPRSWPLCPKHISTLSKTHDHFVQTHYHFVQNTWPLCPKHMTTLSKTQSNSFFNEMKKYIRLKKFMSKNVVYQ